MAAHHFQNIVMCPGIEDIDVTIHHLKNCPIEKNYLHATKDIFGPNLGSLKGKTLHCPNSHVSSSISGVPPEIMQLYHQTSLAINLRLANSIPFITIAQNLKFGTVKALPNPQVPTIKENLHSVIMLYCQCGFTISPTKNSKHSAPGTPCSTLAGLGSMFPMLNGILAP